MIETKRIARVRRWLLGCVLAFAGIAAAPFACADTMLVEASPYISGTQSTVYSLLAPGAGSLSVSLTDLGWPDRLSNLSFALTTSTDVLKTLDGGGDTTVDLSSAGTYYAIVSGTAQGYWNLGMYSLRIGFSPLGGTPAPVPLPGALLLLLSGIAGVFGVKRNRAMVPALAN